jgi:hypothetical protein
MSLCVFFPTLEAKMIGPPVFLKLPSFPEINGGEGALTLSLRQEALLLLIPEFTGNVLLNCS